MKLNFNIINKKKNTEKENSKLLERILIEYLSDYFENVEFDYNFGREGFTFLAKEVEFRRDLLQKFGIPLELTIGKIKVIKLSVKSLITLKNFAMEISDIEIEVQTIHISKDYKKNYLNYRKKFLNEWEKKHKKFFNSMAKHSILESFIVDRLIPIKIDIKNINIKISDSISSKKTIKQLEINIDSIHSLGCNSKWEEIEEVEKDDIVYRTMEISSMCATVNKIDKKNNYYVETLLSEFNLIVKLNVLRTFKTCDLKTTPKLKLEIIFTTPLVINLSVSNINILQNLLTYLTNVKTVEKYWVNRPEFHEEGKINKSDALKWFLYAFRVLREEIRNNKRQNYELSTLIDKIISMEKYIQYYKESHKLLIAPWIHQKDHKIELQNLENKMSLEDIIYCRELSFAELLTEGRAFCASGEVGEGYKPFVHLWEFYVNDLRTKWMNKEDNEVTTIKLSDNERRELMTIWKNDRDMVLLSYIKGEPNHPKDIMLDCEIQLNLIILNFSRNVDFQLEKDQQVNFKNLIDYSTFMYNSKIKDRYISDLKFSKAIKSLSKERMELYLKDEVKNDNNNDSDDEAMQLECTIQSKSHDYLRRSSSIRDTNKENQKNIITTEQNNEDSCIYIDEIIVEDSNDENINNNGDPLGNENDIPNKDIRHIGSGNMSILKGKKTELGKTFTQKIQKEKKVLFNKTLFSVFLFTTNLKYTTKRNEQTDIFADIFYFHIIDHNFTYITMNKGILSNNGKGISIDKIIKNQILSDDKNKHYFSSFEIGEIPEKIDESLIYYLVDIIKDQKCRETILKYYSEENNFFYLYEDSFGFKKCETKGQGLTSLKNHYSKIVIDYLIKKNIFSDVKQQILDVLANKLKRKIEKFTEEEKNEILKKTLVKAFEDYINPDNKKLYEQGIQEKFIQTMISDLNSMFEITSIFLIKEIICCLYSFHINDNNFSKLLSDHIKRIGDVAGVIPKKEQFLNFSIHKKGREYPNYIMKTKDDLVEDTEVSDDGPNSIVKIEINRDINMKITNELIAEFQLIFPEISQHEKYTYVGNILNDLTQSYLSIFDDFRQLRAKFGVFKDVEKKYKNGVNQNEPVEILYLDNLTKHLKELSNAQHELTVEMEKDKKIQIFIYDKIFFLDNQAFSSFGLVLQGIKIQSQLLKKIPLPMEEKNSEYHKIPLPENYDMNKICKMLFSTTASIETIEVVVDDCEPIIKTDIQINETISLMKNSLFIPDIIIDAHTNNLEFNIYPCLVKMMKNAGNIAYFQDLYMSKIKKKVIQSKYVDSKAQIVKNNFDRFIRNLNIFFKDKCSYEPESNDSKLKNLEFYLEKRNNIILMYSIGHSSDENKGITVNVYSQDNFKENQIVFTTIEDLKQVHTVRVNNKLLSKGKSNNSSSFFEKNQRLRTNSMNFANGNNYFDFGAKVEPFFTFKCDLLVFNSVTNLFFTQQQIWLCPIKTVKLSSYETFKIELNNCEPFTFSSNEYMFCKHFVDAVTQEKINFGNLSENFPYDNALKIKNLNFNCLFKQTSFFYEESPDLREIYLKHFKNTINNYEMAKLSKYLSNLSINVNTIDISIIFKNNKDLIDLIAGALNYNNLYYTQNYKHYLDQRKINTINITSNMFASQHAKKRKTMTTKTLPLSNKKISNFARNFQNTEKTLTEISVHVNEININKFNFEFTYENKDEIQNKNKNLQLIFTIKNIKYVENSYNVNERKENEIKAHLFILSILAEITIPKNFDNEKDLDSKERVPIFSREYLKKRFEKMKNDKLTDNERIIFQIQSTSLKLLDESKVSFEIGNSIKLGFNHNQNTYDIDDYIFWVFPYSNGTKEEQKLIQERINMIPNPNFKKLDPSFKKSLSIIFDKVDPTESDPELEKFNDVNKFSNFQKMMVIIQSTFGYKMIYTAKARVNIGVLQVSGKLYEYMYYFGNWKRQINRIIEENHPSLAKKKVKQLQKNENKENSENPLALDLNNESIAPLEGENSVIFSLQGQMMFLTFIQDQIPFSNFLYMKSTIEIYKNSNNEKILYFGCVDFNWKALNTRVDNLFFKKNPNDKKKKMLEIHMILDNSKIVNPKNKTQHEMLVEFNDCICVYFMKHVGECLDFLDYNEEILFEYPLKTEIWSMLPQIKKKVETFYYNFNNFSIILPESTKSANYMRFNCTKGCLATTRVVGEVTMVEVPQNKKIFVIDKKTMFGLSSQRVSNKNTIINDIDEKNNENNCYFYLTELDSSFQNVDSILCVEGETKDFLIADKVNINLTNPKSDHPITHLYNYYWKLNNQKVVRIKNTLSVSMVNAKLNITLGDVFAVDHFIDNNFDENSPLYEEKQQKFNFMEYEAKFDELGTIDVNVFKVFKSFFEKSKKIERIGQKLPGYDNEIIYDTQI